jgi:phosphatidylserine/phosphatidylglycerophosphate/cardiolipin synthase-like enzyme
LDDCRIIFRDFLRVNTRDCLRLLREFGFNMSKVRVMKNCHTKGILVDSRWTLLGSHNWTNEGTSYNRDASLLFDDGEITKYFEDVFAHDWEQLAYEVEIGADESAPFITYPGEAVSESAMGFAQIRWDPNDEASEA